MVVVEILIVTNVLVYLFQILHSEHQRTMSVDIDEGHNEFDDRVFFRQEERKEVSLSIRSQVLVVCC